MTRRINVAVVAASGQVGETLLTLLEERSFPVGEVFLLDEEGKVGETLRRFGKSLKVQSVSAFDFSGTELAFFCGDASLTHANAPAASEAGCAVIDCSGAYADDPEVPLVIPEVNPGALEYFRERNIIASPSATTIFLLMVLFPLQQAVGVVHADVVTYQAVSDFGKAGVDELSGQVVSLLNMRDVSQSVFPQRVAFNVIPQVGELLDNGYSDAEIKMVTETQKILADATISVTPTAVQVPVFYGHSLAVHLQMAATVTVEEARAILDSAPGLLLVDKPGEPTPAIQANEQDAVLVGRLREDLARPGGLNLWITADNSRKGAALNAVQIAELVEKCYM